MLDGRLVRIYLMCIVYIFELVWVSLLLLERYISGECRYCNHFVQTIWLLRMRAWKHKAIIDIPYNIQIYVYVWRLTIDNSWSGFSCISRLLFFLLSPMSKTCTIHTHAHINDYDDKVFMIGSFSAFMTEKKVRKAKELKEGWMVYNHVCAFRFSSFLSRPRYSILSFMFAFCRVMLSHP